MVEKRQFALGDTVVVVVQVCMYDTLTNVFIRRIMAANWVGGWYY